MPARSRPARSAAPTAWPNTTSSSASRKNSAPARSTAGSCKRFCKTRRDSSRAVSSMDLWLRTDEIQEAVLSLEAAYDFAERCKSELYYWKWTLIALHNAVQGFMVIAL